MGSILSAIGTLLTAFGVCAAVMQLRANGRQALSQFEESLTARYRQLVAELPVWAFFELDELSAPQREKILEESTLSVFYRYFDLCNEQVFLYHAGRITQQTWQEWVDGIRGNLRRPAFEHAWEAIKPNVGQDFSQLRRLLRDLAQVAAPKQDRGALVTPLAERQ